MPGARSKAAAAKAAKAPLTVKSIVEECSEAGWTVQGSDTSVTVTNSAGRSVVLPLNSTDPRALANQYARLQGLGLAADLQAARQAASPAAADHADAAHRGHTGRALADAGEAGPVRRRRRVVAPAAKLAPPEEPVQEALMPVQAPEPVPVPERAPARTAPAPVPQGAQQDKAWTREQITGLRDGVFHPELLPQPVARIDPAGRPYWEAPTFTLLVGPEEARDWVMHPVCNHRPRKEKTYREIKEAIENGSWDTTHQGLAVCREHGGLLDGMNRMRVVLALGVQVLVKVTYAVPHELFHSMDTGSGRSIADLAAIDGHLAPELTSQQRSVAMATVRNLLAADRGMPWSSWPNYAPENKRLLQAVADYQAQYPGGQVLAEALGDAGHALGGLLDRAAVVGHMMSKSADMVPSGAALAIFQIFRAWPDSPYAEPFLNALRTGYGLRENDPAGVLREKFLGSRRSAVERRIRIPAMMAALTIKGYNRTVVQELLGIKPEPWDQVRLRVDEAMPVAYDAESARRAADAERLRLQREGGQ